MRHGIPAPRHRLPPTSEPGRVRLQVADLEHSLDYYGRVLGMRTLQRDADAAILGAVGSDRPLVELHQRAGAAPVPARGHLGLFHFALLLPGRAALGSFVRHLADKGERAGASNHLVSEALYLHDPDGLGIEVYADRPREEWRYEDGQLVMATHALDTEAVVRSAGSVPWRGMPAGTTMGHVHLRVGDLGEAEAFYHEALGLDKTVWSYPGALFLSAGDYHHHLGVNSWAGDAPTAGEGEARLLSWTLSLPDEAAVDRAARSLDTAGYPVTGTGRQVVVVDPWGTTLTLRVRD